MKLQFISAGRLRLKKSIYDRTRRSQRDLRGARLQRADSAQAGQRAVRHRLPPVRGRARRGTLGLVAEGDDAGDGCARIRFCRISLASASTPKTSTSSSIRISTPIIAAATRFSGKRPSWRTPGRSRRRRHKVRRRPVICAPIGIMARKPMRSTANATCSATASSFLFRFPATPRGRWGRVSISTGTVRSFSYRMR